MRLIDYWHIARRRWILISAITLLCVAGAAGYSSMQPTTYQSTSRLYVTMATGTSVNDVYQGGLAAQQRVTSYVNLAASSNVAQRVVDQLGLPMSAGELQGKITASFPPGHRAAGRHGHRFDSRGCRHVDRRRGLSVPKADRRIGDHPDRRGSCCEGFGRRSGHRSHRDQWTQLAAAARYRPSRRIGARLFGGTRERPHGPHDPDIA